MRHRQRLNCILQLLLVYFRHPPALRSLSTSSRDTWGLYLLFTIWQTLHIHTQTKPYNSYWYWVRTCNLHIYVYIYMRVCACVYICIYMFTYRCQEKQQPRTDCGKYNSRKLYQINFILVFFACHSKIFFEHSRKKCTPNAIVLPLWSTAQKKHWMEINRSYMVSRNTLMFKVQSSNIHVKHFHPPICLAVPFSKSCFNSALNHIHFLAL